MSLNRNSIFLLIFSFSFTIYISIQSSLSYKIVFCDVGQGAATLVQLGTYQALIDTGPNQRVLSCIGRHIPFFDHTIETVIISHNQKDHTGGLASINKKYKTGQIYREISNDVSIQINKVTIAIHKASQSSKDINEAANVVTIFTPLQTVFLTSDINGIQLKELMPRATTIFEVPHHGSKYGLYPDSLDLARLTLAVISVGKKNSYGHPSKEVLSILKARKIQVWRTDEQGELVINL